MFTRLKDTFFRKKENLKEKKIVEPKEFVEMKNLSVNEDN